MMIELLKATNANGVPTYTVEQTLHGIGSLVESKRVAVGGGGTEGKQYTFTSPASIQDNRMVRINGLRLRVVSSRRGISGYSVYSAGIDG